MTPAPAPTCIVLAGGLGTRLRGVVKDRPKCLAPVGSRSFLDIQLDRLFAAGVGEVVLSLGHEAEQVIDAVRSRSAKQPIRWVVEPTLLGTGGAITHVLDTLGLTEAWVANGDTYLDGDLTCLLPPLRPAAGERLRMALVQVADRGRFGGVQSDADGRVTGFCEKGSVGAGWINAGLYHLHRDALPSGRQGAYSLETEVLPQLVAERAVTCCRLPGNFIDIGVPEDYRRFCEQYAP